MRLSSRVRSALVVGAALVAVSSLTGCERILAEYAAAVAADRNLEQASIERVNAYRAMHGLGALAVHPVLEDKARAWAASMASGACGVGVDGVPKICHSNLTDGITVPYTLVLENVGAFSPAGDVDAVQRGFEQSGPHAAAMLDGRAMYVGVGVAYWQDRMYVAQVFMATP